MWENINQTVIGQTPHGVADRGAADSKLLGDTTLGNALPGLEFFGHDEMQQVIVSGLAQTDFALCHGKCPLFTKR